MFQLIANTIIDVLLDAQLRRCSNKEEKGWRHAQYCRGLYPWYEPFSFILATYGFLSSSATWSNGILAMSKIRSV